MSSQLLQGFNLAKCFSMDDAWDCSDGGKFHFIPVLVSFYQIPLCVLMYVCVIFLPSFLPALLPSPSFILSFFPPLSFSSFFPSFLLFSSFQESRASSFPHTNRALGDILLKKSLHQFSNIRPEASIWGNPRRYENDSLFCHISSSNLLRVLCLLCLRHCLQNHNN